MRRAGRLRARFARPARRSALLAAAGFIWAVALAEPAASPPAWPAIARGETTLYAELTGTWADRRHFPAAASRSAPAAPPRPPVVWPAAGDLTGWYGERRGSARHPGVDIDGATGDDVVAAAAGLVAHAGPSPAGYAGYGDLVIVDHGELTTIYAHLSKVAVAAGDVVFPGQPIGAIGTTGSVTGSHLHFEVRRGAAAVDPEDWLPARHHGGPAGRGHPVDPAAVDEAAEEAGPVWAPPPGERGSRPPARGGTARPSRRVR